MDQLVQLKFDDCSADLAANLEILRQWAITNHQLHLNQLKHAKCHHPRSAVVIDDLAAVCERSKSQWVWSFYTSTGEKRSTLEMLYRHEWWLEHSPLRIERCPVSVHMVWLNPMPLDATSPPSVMVAPVDQRLQLMVQQRVWQLVNPLAKQAQQVTRLADVDVRVVLHGADQGPTNAGALLRVRDMAVAGSKWRRKDRKGVFNWVYGMDHETPMYYHDSQRPLLVASVCEAETDLVRTVMKSSGLVRPLVIRGADFRAFFDASSPQRQSIYKWEHAVQRGACLLAVRLDKHFTLGEAIATAGDLPHIKRHGTWHTFWAVHSLDVCSQTFIREGEAKRPYRTHFGVPGSAKWAVWSGMVAPFASFATEVYRQCVPSALQRAACETGRVIEGMPWSYASVSVYADRSSVDRSVSRVIHGGLQGESNTVSSPDQTKHGMSKGLDLHFDESDFSFSVVLVVGQRLEGFDQLYPTLGLRLGCPCWAYVAADSAALMHAVSQGRGVRLAFVFAIHEVMWSGVSSTGKPVVWSELREAQS